MTVKYWLCSYLEENEMYTGKQFGFYGNNSCESVFLEVSDLWLYTLENGKLSLSHN